MTTSLRSGDAVRQSIMVHDLRPISTAVVLQMAKLVPCP
jgi:hypothetical protein